MASDEADDGKRRTSPHSSGSQQQRRLFAIIFALSITLTISLLFFFYHIRIKIKPSGKLDAEQKDDERGRGVSPCDNRTPTRRRLHNDVY